MAARYTFRSRAITKKNFGWFHDSSFTPPTIPLLVLLLIAVASLSGNLAVLSDSLPSKRRSFASLKEEHAANFRASLEMLKTILAIFWLRAACRSWLESEGERVQSENWKC